MATRILVPLDGHTDPVLPLVASLARGDHATVRLLRVMDAPSGVEAFSRSGAAAIERAVERQRARAEADLAAAGAELDGIPVETAIRFGDPAIAAELEAGTFGADLVAVSISATRLAAFFRPRLGDALAQRRTLPLLALQVDERAA